MEGQKWKRYCFFRYKCYVYEKELHTRGNSYRTDYFRTHKPTVSGRYHCAYCGRFLSKDALAVDHLIPVQKAKSSGFWQWVLRATRIQNVNSPKNLVGACQRCNSKKGAKASFWVLRGFLGQFFLFWLLVWGLLLFGLCFLFSYYRGEFAELIRFFLGFLGVSI